MNLGNLKGGDTVTLVGHRAQLTEEVIYTSPDGVVVIVPAGFQYDGASIPDFAWSIVGHPYQRGYRRAAAVHDYLMQNRMVTSKLAHRYFRNCLILDRVNSWRVNILYKAVSLFGPKF